MKIITLIFITILLINTQAFAELKLTDLDKIKTVVKEVVTPEIEKVNLNFEKVNLNFEKVDIKMTELEKRLAQKIDSVNTQLTDKIEAVEKQTGRNFVLITSMFVFLVVAVGIPQIITSWQGRKIQETNAKYDIMMQEIEILKEKL